MGGENKDILSPPAVDNYKVVFDYNGCTNNATAVVNPVPVISTKDVIACNTATLTASSDITNVNWSWAAPIGGTTQTVTTPVIPNDTTKYYMTATVATTGCATTDSVYVIGINNPQMVQLDTMSCQGLQVRLTARPTNIPDLDKYLKVSFGWVKDGVLPGFAIDSVVTVNAKGQYVGTVTIDQCIGTSTNNVDFAPNPVSTLPDVTRFCIDDGESATLDAGNTGGNLTYLWSTTEVTQTIIVQPTSDQYYSVVLTNPFFCTTKDSILVKMICKPNLSTPSGFIPGSDKDGIFRPFGNKNNFSSYEMMVFNRWGEIIFISNDILVGWDGTYKNELMPLGVYPYVIKYEGREEFKGPYKITGAVTLIR
jgi:gliding motility-associated-like protein